MAQAIPLCFSSSPLQEDSRKREWWKIASERHQQHGISCVKLESLKSKAHLKPEIPDSPLSGWLLQGSRVHLRLATALLHCAKKKPR